MGEKALNSESHATFQGMVSTVDPHDVQPGQAVVQINVTAVRPGEMNIRGGMTELQFEEET